MKKSIIASTLLLLLFSFQSSAQGVSSADLKSMMVKEWQRAKTYTVEYLNTMPANDYSFKAVDSIRSFAQQMIHLAEGNYFLMSNGTGSKPPTFANVDLEHSAGAQSKDSVMYYVTNSYDYCINAVQASDVNKWGEMVKVFGLDQTRLAMMMKTFEHQTHHRGQTTIYIRLKGIRPPQEKLF